MDGVDQSARRAAASCLSAGERYRALATVPSVVSIETDNVDLFARPLANIPGPDVTGRRVDAPTPGIT